MNRTIIPLVMLIAASPTLLLAQTTIPGGNVSGTWTAAGSPYLVQGNIAIHTDSTLNIQPGVEVSFQGNYLLTVNGFLQAIGTATDSIHFRGTSWSGIAFSSAPDSSHMAYCTVSGSTGLGGIRCTSSNPVITHSSISNNTHGVVWGGIALQNSNASISHCAIVNNENYGEGGGIRIAGGSPQISYCNITGNYGMQGGGIYCAGGAPFISNTRITGNRSGTGGGINVSGGQVTITDCIITADTASGMGGGIYVSSPSGSLTINNSTISNCKAPSGGGVYVNQAANVSIIGSTFESNGVNNAGGGGAMYIYQAGTVSIMRTTLDDNFCGSYPGGVIYSVNCSNLIIDHCDVVNNHGLVIEGGIILNGNTTMTLKNSIFKNQQGAHIWFENYTSASVSYSDFYGTPLFYSPPTGLGVLTQTNSNGDSCDVFYNIYLDPLFVDFSNGDYHLTGPSPCIDAGDPSTSYDPDSTVADIGALYFNQLLITVSDALLDFGIVDIGQQLDLPLTIRNGGTAPLRLQNVSNQHSVFAHNWNPVDSLIMPNDSLTVTVTFTPADANVVVDTLLIMNNARPLEVQLSGKGKTVVGIEDQSELPKVYALYPAYPNPFNPTTTIRYGLPWKSVVYLTVYDLLGHEVAILVQAEQEAGYHEMRFDASALASGVYIYKLQAGDFLQTRKVLLLR